MKNLELQTERAPRGEGHRREHPIPAAALDDRLGFIGTSGSGKTYNAGTAVEILLGLHKARAVIIDPLGVWWGLRLMADGKQPSELGRRGPQRLARRLQFGDLRCARFRAKRRETHHKERVSFWTLMTRFILNV